MKEDIAQIMIDIAEERRRRARNAALLHRLTAEKSFEELLKELSALKGLNAREEESGAGKIFAADVRNV